MTPAMMMRTPVRVLDQVLRAFPNKVHARPTHSSMSALTMVPLHTKLRLIQPCIDLLNDEWPNGKSQRLEILEKINSGLPYSVALVSNFDQPSEKVLGHTRLVEVRNVEKGVYTEASVIDKRYRNQGFGLIFLKMTEDLCRSSGFKWHLLSTTPQLSKAFITHGYSFCDWRVETIGSGMLATTGPVIMDQPCPGWECFYREPDVTQIKLASINQPDVNKTQDSRRIEDNSTKRMTDTTNPDNETYNDCPPIWSFTYFDQNRPFCWIKGAL